MIQKRLILFLFLTSSEKHLLSKEFRFAIPPRQVDYSGYLVEYELHYRSTAGLSTISEDRERFKAKLKDIALLSYKLLIDNCKYENNLSSEKLSSLKALMRNKNNVIQKAGKGNTVVIIDKEKYIQCVRNVIFNSSKFIPLNIAPEDYIKKITVSLTSKYASRLLHKLDFVVLNLNLTIGAIFPTYIILMFCFKFGWLI